MILLPVLFYVCELALSKDKSANDICIYDRGRYMTIYIKNLYTYSSVHNKLVGLRCLPTQVGFKSTLKPFINDTAAPKGTASTALFLHTAVYMIIYHHEKCI